METTTATATADGGSLLAFIVGLASMMIGKCIYDYVKEMRNPSANEVKALADLEGRIANIEWRTTQMEASMLEKVDKSYYDLAWHGVRELLESNKQALDVVRSEISELRKVILADPSTRNSRHPAPMRDGSVIS